MFCKLYKPSKVHIVEEVSSKLNALVGGRDDLSFNFIQRFKASVIGPVLKNPPPFGSGFVQIKYHFD